MRRAAVSLRLAELRIALGVVRSRLEGPPTTVLVAGSTIEGVRATMVQAMQACLLKRAAEREKRAREPLRSLLGVLQTAAEEVKRQQTAAQDSRERQQKKLTYWQCHCSTW